MPNINFSEENDDEESSYGFRERPREFFRRHLQNMVHFLVEDWFLSAMLGFITAILSISVDLGYEYLNHCKYCFYILNHLKYSPLRSSSNLRASHQT